MNKELKDYTDQELLDELQRRKQNDVLKYTYPTKILGFIDEDGQNVDIAMFDGYGFGDRILEGVMFIITLKKDGIAELTIDEGSIRYFKSLNTEKWFKDAAKYAEGRDMFYSIDDDSIELAAYYSEEERLQIIEFCK